MDNYIRTIINGLKAWVTSRLTRLESNARQALTTANEAQTAVENKMSAINPKGTGYFSMGRKENTRIGNYSHAEGYSTEASGNYSHAEGYSTEASGDGSHAEGSNTIASCWFQHVEGRYNIKDTAYKYAHIVGNGFDSGRSNAYTLGWNGVPWYQGRPQFGGNAQDDGSQTVMANGDTEVVLKSASKKWKITVDDTGALTTTEVTE